MSAFFTEPFIRTILLLLLCFGVGFRLQKMVPFLRQIRMPIAIVAGLLGFILRTYWPEDTLDLEVLKMLVYHGLALVFLSVGLQMPPKNAQSKDAISYAFAISSTGAIQGLIGLGVVITMGLIWQKELHPGLGFLLPLGFNQGPGQALSFGQAWESTGLVNGGDLGIIMAAVGFAWSIFIGVPLVIYGQRKGWVSQTDIDLTTKIVDGAESLTPKLDGERFVGSLTWVATGYLAVFVILMGLETLLVAKPKVVSMLWGLHFLVALFVALGMRKILMSRWEPQKQIEHNQNLNFVSNIIVDITAFAGIAAIEVAVLSDNWLLIVLTTTLGGIATLLYTKWIYTRVFSQFPFHHLVLWFGTSTGTLPMGLTLLRMIDPNLRSTAPTSATVGAAFALLTSFPLLIVMGMTINSWPNEYPTTKWIILLLLILYWSVLIFVWRKIAWVSQSSKSDHQPS